MKLPSGRPEGATEESFGYVVLVPSDLVAGCIGSAEALSILEEEVAVVEIKQCNNTYLDGAFCNPCLR